MNTIIIYGDRKDTQIKDILLKNLSNKFQINYVSDTIISSFLGNLPINIVESSSISEIKAKNAILILKNSAKINSIKFIDKSTNIIINSNNTKNLLLLSKSVSNVYTCGFSSKDYVTFSSREDENGIVSLQRSIKLLDGNICEPMEISCSTHMNMNDYSILASILSLILLGSINENNLIF